MKTLGRRTRLFWLLLAPLTLALTTGAAGARGGGREYLFDGEPLDAALQTLARDACLRVEYDEPARAFARGTRVTFRAANTTPAGALSRLLNSQPVGHEYRGGDTLFVFRGPYVFKDSLGQLRRIVYLGELEVLVKKLAEDAGMGIDLEKSRAALPRRHARFEMRDVSPGRALQALLAQQGLTYERDGCGPIIVVKDETVVR